MGGTPLAACQPCCWSCSVPPVTGLDSQAWLILPLAWAGFHPVALPLQLMGLVVPTRGVFLGLELNRLLHFKAPLHPRLAPHLLNISSSPNRLLPPQLSTSRRAAQFNCSHGGLPLCPAQSQDPSPALCPVGSWPVTRTCCFGGGMGHPGAPGDGAEAAEAAAAVAALGACFPWLLPAPRRSTEQAPGLRPDCNISFRCCS